MKKCPYCAEEIQDDATVCRHCHRSLNTQMNPFAILSFVFSLLWLMGIGSVLAIIFGVIALSQEVQPRGMIFAQIGIALGVLGLFLMLFWMPMGGYHYHHWRY